MHGPGRRIAARQPVDVSFRIRDRRIRIGPCEADFERRKLHTIDDDRL
jgi:hypothetical protein